MEDQFRHTVRFPLTVRRGWQRDRSQHSSREGEEDLGTDCVRDPRHSFPPCSRLFAQPTLRSGKHCHPREWGHKLTEREIGKRDRKKPRKGEGELGCRMG